MKQWRQLAISGAAFIGSVFLAVSYWREGNHDASWGWIVASLYPFAELCESLTEVCDARANRQS